MNNKIYYMTLIVAILVLVGNLIAYPFLPDRVPVHWGLSGDVDRYGAKTEQLLMGGLPLVLFFVLKFLPSIDPKRDSYRKHQKAYSKITLLIILFLSIANIIALSSALGVDVNFSIVMPFLLGLLFIGLGNFMTQIRHNYFVGIRTPWTLASERVWKKTHRFGGFVFVVVGIIPLSSIIFGALSMKLFFASLLIGISVIYLYSYIVYKQKL